MAEDPHDDFSKFFLPHEWAEMDPKERFGIKIMFLNWLGTSAEPGHEERKPEFMKKYDVRRAKLLAERRESLARSKSGACGEKANRRKQNKGTKQPESDSLPYQEVLKGFSELEISEAQAAVSPLKSKVQKCLDEFDSSDSDVSESDIYKRRYRLRQGKRVNYNEDKEEERDFDEFIYCPYCDGYYLDFCLKHPLLTMPDDQVTEKLPGKTMAEMTCPARFLKIAPSRIPGAGLGVFTRCHLPRDVRFGPNRGVVVSKVGREGYTWQTSETSKQKKQLIDSADPEKSNWLRYFNCARSWSEQNTTVFQYQGKLYYRSIRNVPPDTELLIFYGMDYAKLLGIDMERYHLPLDTDHNNNGNNRNLSCESCQLTFSTQQSLNVHRNICGNVSSSIVAEDIHRHKRRQNTRNAHQRESSPESLKDNGDLSCKVCHKTFSKSQILQTHMKLHRKRSRGVTSSDTSGVVTESRAEPSRVKQYICHVCNKVFDCNSNLSAHMRIHTGERPYKCEVCEKSFKQSSHLTTHMRTHTGQKPYICEVCEKGFTVNSNLTTHMRTHTGERPYICKVCDESFNRSSILTRHMRTHTGERPYVCEACNKGFSDRNSLSNHKQHPCEQSKKLDKVIT